MAAIPQHWRILQAFGPKYAFTMRKPLWPGGPAGEGRSRPARCDGEWIDGRDPCRQLRSQRRPLRRDAAPGGRASSVAAGARRGPGQVASCAPALRARAAGSRRRRPGPDVRANICAAPGLPCAALSCPGRGFGPASGGRNARPPRGGSADGNKTEIFGQVRRSAGCGLRGAPDRDCAR